MNVRKERNNAVIIVPLKGVFMGPQVPSKMTSRGYLLRMSAWKGMEMSMTTSMMILSRNSLSLPLLFLNQDSWRDPLPLSSSSCQSISLLLLIEIVKLCRSTNLKFSRADQCTTSRQDTQGCSLSWISCYYNATTHMISSA